MKVLHLLSDWKWTGSSDPVVSLCEALAQEGIDVTLAYRKTPEHDFEGNTVEKEVRKRGIQSYDSLRLNRYFSMKDWVYDIRYIKDYVEKEGFDIVHANLAHDHFLSLLSFKFGKFAKKRPLLIRTDHKRDGIPAAPFMKWALSNTDALVAYSSKIIEHDIETFGYPRNKTYIIQPAIKPFDGEIKDLRKALGLEDNLKVIGVVGRLKPERGYSTIFKAFKIARTQLANIKLVVVGRGGSKDNVIVKNTIEELGIKDDVILAGYRSDDYFSVISTFDIYVMMRAGTDGTARALREVMSFGVPPIVSDLGMLPELVNDDSNGYVVRPQEDMLADKMIDLLLNDEKRLAFGKKAKEYARDSWAYKNQALTMISFYEKILFHF